MSFFEYQSFIFPTWHYIFRNQVTKRKVLTSLSAGEMSFAWLCSLRWASFSSVCVSPPLTHFWELQAKNTGYVSQVKPVQWKFGICFTHNANNQMSDMHSGMRKVNWSHHFSRFARKVNDFLKDSIYLKGRAFQRRGKAQQNLHQLVYSFSAGAFEAEPGGNQEAGTPVGFPGGW